jgi:DNA-binding GntR family transcriptional regulator
VRDRLRGAILSGELLPGTPLSAVQLAASYGLSRTPVREAIRLLQEEGLLVSEGNRRPHVAPITPDELEGIYAQRILLYALTTMLTVPMLSGDEIEHMQSLCSEMNLAAEQDDVRRWQTADRAFHETHTMHVSEPLRAELLRLRTRYEYFLTIWFRGQPHQNLSARTDHDLILQHCRAGDSVAAAHAASIHLARISLIVLSEVAPEREQNTIRMALSIATAGYTNGNGATAAERSAPRASRFPDGRQELFLPGPK